MNWRKLENTFDVVGMFVFVKGTVKGSNYNFYEVGRLGRFNNDLAITSAITNLMGKPTNLVFDFEKCEYWYINIDEIK